MNLKNVISFVALAVIAGFVAGSIPANTRVEKVVTAEEFRLVDSEGNTLATLGQKDGNITALWIYGKDGMSRIALFVDKDDNRMLSFYNKENEPRVVLGMTETEQRMLSFYDSRTEPRFITYLDPQGTASLFFYDEKTRHRAGMGYMEPEKLVDISVYDEEGNISWTAVSGETTENKVSGADSEPDK